MKHPLSDGRCVGVGEPRRTGHLPGRNRPEAPEVRAPERPGAQLPQAGAVGGAQGPKARASRTRTSGVRSLGGISKSTSRGRSYRSPLWGAGAVPPQPGLESHHRKSKEHELSLWNLTTPPPSCSHTSETETKPELCCNVFIMCQKNYTTAYPAHL